METPKLDRKRKLVENELGQICLCRMGGSFDSPGNCRLVDGSPISDTTRNIKKQKKIPNSPINLGGNDPNMTPQ